MALPIYEGNGGIQASVTATVNVSFPATVNNNDILFASLVIGENTTLSAPAGWTLIHSAANTGGRYALYWQRADGTESGTDTFTAGNNSFTACFAGTIHRVSGCITTGTPYENKTTPDSIWDFLQNTGQDILNSEFADSLGTDRLALAIGHVEDNTINAFTGIGWTEEARLETTLSADASLTLASYPLAAIGKPTTVGWGLSASDYNSIGSVYLIGATTVYTIDDTTHKHTATNVVLEVPSTGTTVDLGKWSGGTVTTLPTGTWAVPSTNIFPTEDRNDNSVYGLSAHVLTLPSADLADGYLVVAAFEIDDDSNGRANPQGRFVYSGSGTSVGNYSSGYLRDNSEDRAYVRCWAFVDSAAALDTFTFQWRTDTDAASNGTARSEFQVIPLYYGDAGIYSSAATSCLGGITPNQIGGFTGTDGTNINIASNVVTVSGDNKKYLCLGGYYWQGIGNARTQRWGGFRFDNVADESVKGYSYGRNAANADIGELFTTIIETATTDIDIDMYVFRGLGVGSGQGGGDVDGNVTGSNPNHAMVILELNDSAEVFKSTSSTNQNIATVGPVDIQATKVADIDISDSASFTRATDIGMNVEVATDVLLGANVSAASQQITTGSRYTGFAEFTVDGVEDSDSFAGDYCRNNQSTTDTFGWSANLLGFQAVTANQDVGISATELVGSEGGNGGLNTQVGWVGFWGLNLNTLIDAGGGDVLLVVGDTTHKQTSENTALTQANTLVVNDTSHAHTTENVGLIQASTLVVSDTTHGHTAENVVLVPVAGDVLLVVSDGAHNQTADSVNLLQDNTLALADASHNQTADSVVLLQANTLVSEDTTHKHTTENVGLQQANTLVVADTTHKQTTENIGLQQANLLTVNDTTHAHTSDNVVLTQSITLVVSNARHAHTSESVGLLQANSLLLQNASHSHTAENVGLLQQNLLTTSDTLHAHTADSVTLSLALTLSVASTTHAHTADNTELTQDGVLLVNNTTHTHTADAANLEQANTLVVAETTHKQTADVVDLISGNSVSVSDTVHKHTAENVGLTQANVLVVANTTHIHTAENVSLGQGITLVVSDTTHTQTSENIGLVQQNTLLTADTSHSHTAENVDLISGNSLSISSTSHAHTAESVILAQANVLAVASTSHKHTADVVVYVGGAEIIKYWNNTVVANIKSRNNTIKANIKSWNNTN